MKNIFLVLLLAIIAISCDKIDNPYPPGPDTELNTALFPGNWSDYPWPTFSDGFPTDRNIVLEDYTGHKCVFCPAAATVANDIGAADSNRVFVISIHTSPGGMGPFQETDAEYTNAFANETAIAYGKEFQSGYGFDANPAGTISRKKFNNIMFQNASDWSNLIAQVKSENDVKVLLTASSNFYTETRGLFVHALIDIKNENPENLRIVAQFVENKVVGKQKFPAGQHDDEYVFHNTLRETLDNAPFGQLLANKTPNADGKYQFDYSYQIPVNYEPSNCHVIVYVMYKDTYEILQAVKIKL